MSSILERAERSARSLKRADKNPSKRAVERNHAERRRASGGPALVFYSEDRRFDSPGARQQRPPSSLRFAERQGVVGQQPIAPSRTHSPPVRSSAPMPPEKRKEHSPKTGPRSVRPFRYLRIPAQDRERIHLVHERVKCGKPSCRCAHGLKHGPTCSCATGTGTGMLAVTGTPG